MTMWNLCTKTKTILLVVNAYNRQTFSKDHLFYVIILDVHCALKMMTLSCDYLFCVLTILVVASYFVQEYSLHLTLCRNTVLLCVGILLLRLVVKYSV